MKIALLAASLVLVAGTATACGGGAPTDASEKDFCAAITKVGESYGDDPEKPAIKDIKDSVADLGDVGTPEGIPDDAREGFEIVVDAIAGLDDDASDEDLKKAGEDFSGDDEKKSDAFDEYVSETCAPADAE
jgi:hypothetical protein